MQNDIIPNIDLEKVAVIGLILGINDETWLDYYKTEKGITFPLFMMEANFYPDYEVGTIFGKYSPNYFIIDRNGIIQKRYDSLYGISSQILADLETVVNGLQ
ncbi:hypothetical protein ACFL4T_10600 [candidate division KSB1 bacterium]